MGKPHGILRNLRQILVKHMLYRTNRAPSCFFLEGKSPIRDGAAGHATRPGFKTWSQFKVQVLDMDTNQPTLLSETKIVKSPKDGVGKTRC